MRRLIVIAFLVACGKGEPTPAPASGSGSAAGAGSGSAVVAAGSAAAAGSGSGSAAPLSPKIKAARCGDPCLFLVDTPLAKLTDTYKTECGGMKTQDLGFEDCKKLDYVRNCMYAAHGVVYKKKKWKAVFEKKPWYDANPAADVKTVLGELELGNVHELHERGKACKKGLKISGADYDRLKAWVGVLPKQPPLPKVIFVDGEASNAKAFLSALQKKVGTGKVKLGGKITADYLGDDLHYTGADYPADDMPSSMVTAIHAADEKKLRGILLRFPDKTPEEYADSSGQDVFLIYDDKDALRGIETRPFVYERGDLDE